MGEHKTNPVAIAAKNGELPPKKKKLSKYQKEALMLSKIEEKMVLPGVINVYGRYA